MATRRNPRRKRPAMAPRGSTSPRGHAAPQAASRLLLLVALTAALTRGAAAYASMPQMDSATLAPNSFVNLSVPAQLAAYAQSQALPSDANVTRPCGCECLPSWTHMILPDYNNRLVALSNYTTLVVTEDACAVDDWPVPWCYVNTTTCPDAVPCVNAIAPWAPCAAAGDHNTLLAISNFDCSVGGASTTDAVPIDAASEDIYAEHPMGCECKTNWTYAGQTWSGCANPGGNWPSAWCYVNTTNCLPGAWACAIEQGLWGQCDSANATMTSNTSSLHMCQTQGPGLHGIEAIKPASASTARNPAIVIGAICGLLGGLVLLAAGLLVVMVRRRSAAATTKQTDDDQAEQGDMDKALQLSSGWSTSTASSSSAPATVAACVMASSLQQVPNGSVGNSWPASVATAGSDAPSAAAMLIMGGPVRMWPLARVSEHDGAALAAEAPSCGDFNERDSERASRRQQSQGILGSDPVTAMGARPPPAQVGQRDDVDCLERHEAAPDQPLHKGGGKMADGGLGGSLTPQSGAEHEAAAGDHRTAPPAVEFPGNPFAAAREQHMDDFDGFPPVPSVRRRTPTPLLSTLRPDYKNGREHPLLRW